MTNEWSSQSTANAKPVTEKVQEEAGQIAGQVQQQVKDAANQAQEQAKSAITERKDMAATRLNTVADALRQTGTQLRDQDQDWMATYSNQVADRVESFASYLEDHNVEDLLREAEAFARRQPELFLGGAFTLGLLAARFFKSSQRNSQSGSRYPITEYEGYNQYNDYGYERNGVQSYGTSTPGATTPSTTRSPYTTMPGTPTTRSRYETGSNR